MNEQKKVFCIVVTYNPDIQRLRQSIRSLENQVQQVVVVDNCSENKDQINLISKKLFLIKLEKNYGLGYAQNIGLLYAIEQLADYVLLLDQDSIPYHNMVTVLINGFRFDKVLAVGSSYWDDRNNVESFLVIEKNGCPKKWFRANSKNIEQYIEVGMLIASGTMIDLPLINDVKGFKNNYFIEQIDTEWSLRVRQKGYKLIAYTTPIMNHTIGDKVKNIWLFGWMQAWYHSPIRDYYKIRNTILLIRELELNKKWRNKFVATLFLYSGYYLLFSDNKFDRLKFIITGFYHGLNGRTGEFKWSDSKLITNDRTLLDP